MSGSPFDVSPSPTDATARSRAQHRQTTLTKPPGSLGRLEDLAIELAAMQGQSAPSSRPAAALLFAASHPVVDLGVAPYPAAVTGAMVANFLAGGAAASVLARHHELPLTVVDVGVDADYPVPSKVAPGLTFVRAPVARRECGDLLTTDALSEAGFAAAYGAGVDRVDALSDATRVLILGEMGIGNSTVAACLGAALLDLPGDALVGPGTGAHGDILERKREVCRQAVQRVREAEPSTEPGPIDLARRLGGRELAAMMGAAARASERGMAVLVDGFIVTAAMLALVRHAPAVRDHLLFAHRSGEPGHQTFLDALEAAPLLDLGLRLGEGSGALTALPLLDAACALHRSMATFESAAIPDKA